MEWENTPNKTGNSVAVSKYWGSIPVNLSFEKTFWRRIGKGEKVG